jgi:hypothetical protein
LFVVMSAPAPAPQQLEAEGFFLEAPQGHSVRLERTTGAKANVRGVYTGDFSSCLLIPIVKGDRISLLHADVTNLLEDFLQEIAWVEFAEDPHPVAAKCEITIFYQADFLLDLERRLLEVHFHDCNLPEIQLVALLALRGPDKVFTAAYFDRVNASPKTAERYTRFARCLTECVKALQTEHVLTLVACGASHGAAASSSSSTPTAIQSVAIEFVDIPKALPTFTASADSSDEFNAYLRRLATASWSSAPSYFSMGVLPTVDRATGVTGHLQYDRTRVTIERLPIVSHPQLGHIVAQRSLADSFCPAGSAARLPHARTPTCVNVNLGGWFPFDAAHSQLPPVDGDTCELKLKGIPTLDLKPLVERCRKEPDFGAMQRTILALLTKRYDALGKQSNMVAINGDMKSFLLRESAHLLSSVRLWIWPQATPAWFWAQDCRKLAQVLGVPISIEVPERTNGRDCSLRRYQSTIHTTLLHAAKVLNDVETTSIELSAIQEVYEHASQAHWSSRVCIEQLTDRLLARCKAGSVAVLAQQPAEALKLYQEAQALCGISQLSNSPRFRKIASNLERLTKLVFTS